MTTDLDTAVINFSKFWYSLKDMVDSKFDKGGLRVDLKNFSRMLQSNAGYQQNDPYQVRNKKSKYE